MPDQIADGRRDRADVDRAGALPARPARRRPSAGRGLAARHRLTPHARAETRGDRDAGRDEHRVLHAARAGPGDETEPGGHRCAGPRAAARRRGARVPEVAGGTGRPPGPSAAEATIPHGPPHHRPAAGEPAPEPGLPAQPHLRRAGGQPRRRSAPSRPARLAAPAAQHDQVHVPAPGRAGAVPGLGAESPRLRRPAPCRGRQRPGRARSGRAGGGIAGQEPGLRPPVGTVRGTAGRRGRPGLPASAGRRDDAGPRDPRREPGRRPAPDRLPSRARHPRSRRDGPPGPGCETPAPLGPVS